MWRLNDVQAIVIAATSAMTMRIDNALRMTDHDDRHDPERAQGYRRSDGAKVNLTLMGKGMR